VALLEDTVLTAPQLATVEAALDRAQLTEYRTDGGRLWVPRARQSAYKRAVVDADAIPKPWGTRLHEAIQSGGVWASPTARAESLKVALQEELSLVLCSMPGIERAAVLYDVEERSGFQQEPLKTASVGIRMAPDAELDPVRATGIRVLVASSIAGLSPERVAVTDLGTGRVHSGPLPDADPVFSSDPSIVRRQALESTLAAKVSKALGFVRGAIVDVAVESTPSTTLVRELPDAGQAHAEPPRTMAAANAPAELLPAAPPPSDSPVAPGAPVVVTKAGPDDGLPPVVHVTVSVPDAYLRAAVDAAAVRARRDEAASTSLAGDEAELERREFDRLRALVGRALPAFTAPEHLRILVTSHPSVGPTPQVAGAPHASPPPAAAATMAGGAEPTARGVVVGTAEIPPSSPLADVPREAWLAATSVFVGLLAGFLWWAGNRDAGRPAEFRPARGPVEVHTDQRVAA
jgi:type III secretory pathway lipoprotein EscJ